MNASAIDSLLRVGPSVQPPTASATIDTKAESFDQHLSRASQSAQSRSSHDSQPSTEEPDASVPALQDSSVPTDTNAAQGKGAEEETNVADAGKAVDSEREPDQEESHEDIEVSPDVIVAQIPVQAQQEPPNKHVPINKPSDEVEQENSGNRTKKPQVIQQSPKEHAQVAKPAVLSAEPSPSTAESEPTEEKTESERGNPVKDSMTPETVAQNKTETVTEIKPTTEATEPTVCNAIPPTEPPAQRAKEEPGERKPKDRAVKAEAVSEKTEQQRPTGTPSTTKPSSDALQEAIAELTESTEQEPAPAFATPSLGAETKAPEFQLHQPAATGRTHHSDNTVGPLQSGQNASNLPEVDRVRFVQRVARAFQAADDQGTPVRLRLSPPELGAMRLEVSVRDGVMTAKMETETQTAKNLLLDNLPTLRERLAEQNIKVERFQVDVMSGQSGGTSSGPEGQGQQYPRSSYQQSRHSRFTSEPTVTAGPPTRNAMTGTNSQLNIII